MSKKLKNVLLSMSFIILIAMPLTTIFAQNYFYQDSWTVIEFKDSYTSGNKVTYLTRYSAKQVRCDVVIRANGAFRTGSGYQTARVEWYTTVDNNHKHEYTSTLVN
ncbi:hypothetical protein [[Eubacterium] hominis]|uniref:hypothetical protein n=1 Tax=[Eubacterium] hominis TaxID=2764325 RepID=UPI003A4DC93D